MKVSIARGVFQLSDLTPGTLFTHDNAIALKTEQGCYVVGTGKPLEATPDLLVTPIRLDFNKGES